MFGEEPKCHLYPVAITHGRPHSQSVPGLPMSPLLAEDTSAGPYISFIELGIEIEPLESLILVTAIDRRSFVLHAL